MANVYLPTVPTRYDPILKERQPVHDVSAASDWGNPILLLQLERALMPDEMGAALKQLYKKLVGFTTEDFIVAIGDPILVAAAAGFVLHKNGLVKMLRWSRINRSYYPIEVPLE